MSASLSCTPVVSEERDAIRFEFSNEGSAPVTVDRWAFSSVCPVLVDGDLTLVERCSTHHVVAAAPPVTIAPGTTHRFGPHRLDWRARHAVDGPCAVYLVDGDDTTPVPTASPRLEGQGPGSVRVEPVSMSVGPVSPGRVATDWHELEAPPATTVHHDRSLPTHTATLSAVDGEITITAADLRAARAALRRCADLDPGSDRATLRPLVPWRGVHLDLARQWYPARVVERLIDTAAALGLERVHLHLTDDEAWRFPVPGLPALTEIGARRGHGLAIPPLLGSGPEPSGGHYTVAEIRSWVGRARRLGVELVPEVDLPGHCFALLQSVPDLRDPAHTPTAVSVQGFVGNVLYPGLPATRRVLDTVIGTVVDLFDASTVHLGGDEVPAGCWDGSPVVAAYAAGHGLAGLDAVKDHFMRDLVEHVRDDLGCGVAVWEEAAGAIEPGGGHVLAWTAHDAVAALVAAGHDVVACPARHWYLDLAVDAEWDTPGTAWERPLDAATAAAATFGSDAVVGAQACLWTEYVPTEADVWDRYHPRLDHLADRMWHLDRS